MPENYIPTFNVFLCHASEDKAIIRGLYQNLTDEGVDVWLDEEKLLPGQDWKAEISKALRNTNAIIVCLSNQSVLKEGFVQKEIKIALDIADEKPEGTIFLIPAKLEDCAVPERLSGIQYVELFKPNGMHRLLLALESRAKSLEMQLRRKKPEPIHSSPSDYELSYLLKEMLHDDDGSQEAISHLLEREPEEDGWFHTEISKELLLILGDKTRLPQERARAGNVLAQLGDKRFRPEAWYLPNDDSLGFVEIPTGVFLMGTANPTNKQEFGYESPQHQITLPRFYIGRYPVTVAQYMAFLKETDSREKLSPPNMALPNHPVTGISWHSAVRYCHWLTDVLGTWSNTPTDIARLLSARENSSYWAIMLPSEAEWEKAARGATDARKYPWGSQIDPNLANFAETGMNKTCAVGCFTGSESPFGIQDMSGNIWEWTRSSWGSNMERPEHRYPYVPEDGREDLQMPANVLKVLRGGSYRSPREDIRCSYRGAELPNMKGEHIGFRLAITPNM
jgi:formylglycine-generating enzyme required for sulfatase activity